MGENGRRYLYRWPGEVAKRLRYPVVGTIDRTVVMDLGSGFALKLKGGEDKIGIYELARKTAARGAVPVHAVAKVSGGGCAVVCALAGEIPRRWRSDVLREQLRSPSSVREPWIDSARTAVAALRGIGVLPSDVQWKNWGTVDGRAVLVDLGQHARVPLPTVRTVESVEALLQEWREGAE